MAGLIEWKLSILTGGPGVGKSTLLAALNDHYEGPLVVALAAKAGLRAHEIAGARHTTIFSILGVQGIAYIFPRGKLQEREYRAGA